LNAEKAGRINFQLKEDEGMEESITAHDMAKVERF
jgi:hypothetical protein